MSSKFIYYETELWSCTTWRQTNSAGQEAKRRWIVAEEYAAAEECRRRRPGMGTGGHGADVIAAHV